MRANLDCTAKNVTNYMRQHIKEKHKKKFKEMQKERQQKSREKRQENRTPDQEMECKESESARRAELRERKKNIFVPQKVTTAAVKKKS